MSANISITPFHWIKFTLIKYIFISKLIKQLPQKLNIFQKMNKYVYFEDLNLKNYKKKIVVCLIYICVNVWAFSPNSRLLRL